MRVLVLAPDTPGYAPLSATAEGGELAWMREELADSGLHVDALIGTVTLTGRGSLSDALRDGEYQALHLITHGDCDAARLTKESLPWSRLGRLLSQHRVELALATTCHSRDGAAAALLAAGVAQVIVTTGEISNDDARQFAREFYGALAGGAPPAEAVAFGRSRMTAEGAAQISLLPDDLDVAPADPLLAALLRVQREQVACWTEVAGRLDALDAAVAAVGTGHAEALRSLTAAVLHIAEVLAR